MIESGEGEREREREGERVRPKYCGRKSSVATKQRENYSLPLHLITIFFGSLLSFETKQGSPRSL